MTVPAVLGHWDVYELVHRVRSAEERPLERSILPALRAGGVRTTVFAVAGDSRSHAGGSDVPLRGSLETMDLALGEIDRTPGAHRVLTREDLDRPDSIGFVLNMEGGRPLEGSLAVLRQFFRLGIRVLQPTWNGRNELGDGVGEGPSAGGLSRFGRAVVKEMRRLGMVLDVSHLAEPGFYDAIEAYDGVVLATHSNARAVHDHPRNLTDAQIRAVAATGGVVGIAFLPAFLGPGTPTVDTVVDHVEHVAGLIGADRVGIGPDFSYGPVAEEHRRQRKYEGIQVDLAVPYPIPDAASIPDLITGLEARGFDDAAIRGVLGENFARAFREILPPASTPGAT